ncbi:MAG: cysteine hydrolase [Anaerolineales bacterium]|nr:cysteine hydrolase [Anaerolineales bacterium]
MKESYFTPQTLSEKSREICQSLESARRSRLERFDPLHSAFLVLDMQEYFLQPGSHAYVPSASAILPGLQALAEAYTAHHLPVIFTRHLNTAGNSGNMSRWWRDLLMEENPLSAITPALNLAQGEMIVKTQYDAFYNTNLDTLLQSLQVRQLVIGGVMTHLCCETTARSAFVRGYDVFFTIDGTATYTEAHHRATLLNLAHGFAVPVLVEEIISMCSKACVEYV